MWSRLVTVVEEMWLTVCRTAFSLVISEAQDFACELLDPDGETLAHSPRAMPVFNLTLPRAVKALLERYPAETLKPGDVLVTNDPWLCAGHLFDIAVVTPVFRDGRLVGLMGTVGHVSDIGGTKDSLHAREIYEEGFQIPPMKLFEAGKPNETLFRLLRRECAQPRPGARRRALLRRRERASAPSAFSPSWTTTACTICARSPSVVQGRSENAPCATRSAPSPDGVYHSEIRNNPLGENSALSAQADGQGRRDRARFRRRAAAAAAGRPELHAELHRGARDLSAEMHADAERARQCRLLSRRSRVKAPEGSILNCKRPAAVNLRTRTGWYLAPNIFRALSEAAPDQVQAFTGLPVAANIYGPGSRRPHLFRHAVHRRRPGRLGAAATASRACSGRPRRPTPRSSCSRRACRCWCWRKAILPDSGGAGRHRGGLGQRMPSAQAARRRPDDAGRRSIRRASTNPIAGPVRRQAGGEASAVSSTPTARVLRDCGTGELVQLDDDERDRRDHARRRLRLSAIRAERSREAVARDIALGLVTPDGARRDYGSAMTTRRNARLPTC